MANSTNKLKLELPLQTEEYDVDIFNANYTKIDTATPRTFISATEPPDWKVNDVWLKIVDAKEIQSQEIIIKTSAYDPSYQFFIDKGEGLQSITNAVDSPAKAQNGDIIITK